MKLDLSLTVILFFFFATLLKEAFAFIQLNYSLPNICWAEEMLVE